MRRSLLRWQRCASSCPSSPAGGISSCGSREINDGGGRGLKCHRRLPHNAPAVASGTALHTLSAGSGALAFPAVPMSALQP